MHSVNKRVQKFVVEDIGISQKAHSNTFQLALQQMQTWLPTSKRQMPPCFFFRGSLTCTICKFVTLSSKMREAMTPQKYFGRPRENGKHIACTHHQPSQLCTTPDYLSLCPISLLDLQCKLCQDIVNQHCTITTWRRTFQNWGLLQLQVCKMERNTQTIMYPTRDTII